MLRVLSFVCLAGCALCSAFSPAPCAAAGAATAWPSPSRHAPADVWTPLPDAGVPAVRGSGTMTGHGRLVSPQVWERYSRRPVVRARESAVMPPVTLPQELSSSRPVKRNRQSGRVAASRTVPKKAAVSTPPKAVKTAPQPKPADTVSPVPAPAAPAPAPAREEAKKEEAKAVTPPAVPEPDNVSASWIIRRNPSPSQAQAAPSPTPQTSPSTPQTPPPASAGEPAAKPETTISAPWILSTSPAAASEAKPASPPASPENVPAPPGA